MSISRSWMCVNCLSEFSVHQEYVAHLKNAKCSKVSIEEKTTTDTATNTNNINDQTQAIQSKTEIKEPDINTHKIHIDDIKLVYKYEGCCECGKEVTTIIINAIGHTNKIHCVAYCQSCNKTIKTKTVQAIK